MIVKICGLMSPLDAIYSNMAGPDMVGFVFHEGSRRFITKERASEISSMLGDITRVGVFVREDPGFIRDMVDSGLIDMVQIHDASDRSYVRRVVDAAGVPVIQAFIINGREDLDLAVSCEADHIMLDAGMGSGRRIDTEILQDVPVPYILSGGLDPSNVLEAVRTLGPAGVDVSSGVETGGAKDPTKMTSFVYAARGNFEPLLEHHRCDAKGVRRGFRDSFSVQRGPHPADVLLHERYALRPVLLYYLDDRRPDDGTVGEVRHAAGLFGR